MTRKNRPSRPATRTGGPAAAETGLPIGAKTAKNGDGSGAETDPRRFLLPDDRPPRIAVAAKLAAPEATEVVLSLSRWLEQRGVRVRLDDPVADAVRWKGDAAPIERLATGSDLVLVLGGDGTLLSVARAIGERRVPIFGVNLGRLGFLTKAPLDQLYPALDAVLDGKALRDERTTLGVTLRRDGEILRQDNVLNDVVVTGSAIARVLEVRIRTSHGFVATVLGDGVIIATPTGSTAYNLGAGGPVVHPAVEAVILVPIVPLTLTQRPVVFPDSEELTLELRSRQQPVHVTFDGQASQALRPGDSLRVAKSPVRVSLLSLPDHNYFRVLRKKLLWGALPPKRGRTVIPEPPDLAPGPGG